jgi:hypothetical protein
MCPVTGCCEHFNELPDSMRGGEFFTSCAAIIISNSTLLYGVNYYKGKGEVVPVLFLTEHHATKAYWGVDV